VADFQSGKPAAVTPRQLLVVGVLGVVLVVVLVVQFGGATSPTADVGPVGPTSPSGLVAGPRPPARPSSSVAESKTALAAWPKLTAEAAAEYDPFAVPKTMAEKIAASTSAQNRKSQKASPKRDASAEKVAALRSKGISLIVRGQRGTVAMIGNRVVRVGDMVEGYRVVSIDLQGVVLAPADREESHEVHP